MLKKLTVMIAFAVVASGCTSNTSNVDNTLSLTGQPNQYNANQTNQTMPTQTPTINSATKPNTKLTQGEIASMSAKVTLKTSKGNITLKLYPEVAPQTVNNFLTKAKDNYYNNLTFHRVEDWVIQGGDPLGNGTGGGKMPTELSNTPFKEGSLGVARGGDIRVSNDSQFFICTQDCAWLTGQYTIFGEVTQGMDVAKSMAVGDKILGIE